MIYTRPSFERAFEPLTTSQQALVNAAISRLEASFGRPHLHLGLGLRLFRPFYEFRAGRNLRVLFLVNHGDFFLVFVGNHDQIKAFIRNNA